MNFTDSTQRGTALGLGLFPGHVPIKRPGGMRPLSLAPWMPPCRSPGALRVLHAQPRSRSLARAQPAQSSCTDGGIGEE